MKNNLHNALLMQAEEFTVFQVHGMCNKLQEFDYLLDNLHQEF